MVDCARQAADLLTSTNNRKYAVSELQWHYQQGVLNKVAGGLMEPRSANTIFLLSLNLMKTKQKQSRH